jgi:hypothetical protein
VTSSTDLSPYPASYVAPSNLLLGRSQHAAHLLGPCTCKCWSLERSPRACHATAIVHGWEGKSHIRWLSDQFYTGALGGYRHRKTNPRCQQEGALIPHAEYYSDIASRTSRPNTSARCRIRRFGDYQRPLLSLSRPDR